MKKFENMYIDFDGVIFPTEDTLFDRYKELKAEGVKVNKLNYLQTYEWRELFERINPIPDSIEALKELKKAIILTKVHSMENEAKAKIDLLRSLNVKNDIIIVPFMYKKTDIVLAKNSILVDDTVHNLDDWNKDGGIPIFFNKDNEDIDSWGKENTQYQKIKSLLQLNNIKY